MADGYSNDYANPNVYAPAQKQPAQVPGVSNTQQPSGSPVGPTPGSPAGFNSMAAQMGLPAQQNFDAIQQAIMRQQSPYVSFGNNGWLQQNHPGVAGALDNVFLSAANLQPGRTTAENIAAIGRAQVGARQMQFQHGVQQAMLPIELAQRQFAYQKNFLDVMKDRAQIDEASQNANMNRWRAANFERLANSATSPYSSQRSDANGFMWGTRKDNGQEEVIPGQPGLENGAPIPETKGAFVPPGSSGRNPTITSLAADVANGVPGAQDKLRIAINANSQVAGGGQNARNQANQPVQTATEFLKTQDQSVNKMIGPEPTIKDYDAAKQSVWDRAMSGQLKTDPMQEIGKIPSLEDQKTAYNARASQIKANYANYVASGVHRKGVPFDPNTTYPAKGKSAPSSQATPANVPGTSAPGARPGDSLNLFNQ